MAEQPETEKEPTAGLSSEEATPGPSPITSEQVRKGEAFLEQAEKKVHSASGWLGKLLG